MKDSGIEWIGEIPEDWNYAPISRLGKITTGNTPSMQGDNNYYENGTLMWVKPDSLNSFIPIKETKERLNIDGVDKARVVPPNTPLICCIASIGKFGYSEQPVAFNQQINAVEFDSALVFWKYGLYFLSTQEEQHLFYSNGNVMKILNGQNQKKIILPLPSYNEQQKIASYLDKKVTIIDNLINKTKLSIEEYQKYKQSLITETVTKGLNPNVKMKYSGIEWIGEIPEHWNIILLSQAYAQVKNKNTNMEETNLLSLSYGNIVNKDINTSDGLLPDNFEGYNVIEAGDIVLRLTDLQNDHKSLRVGLSLQRGIITSAYVTLRKKIEINNWFAYYLLHSFDIYKGFYGMGSGVRQGLTFDGIKTFKFIIPPKSEQNKIIDFINNRVKKINTLIDNKEKLLSELEVYKKSLIYEYVTGKKEVV